MAKASKYNFSTVITVDPEDAVIRFVSMTNSNESTISAETKKCKTKLFDKEFFDVFQAVVQEYANEHPSAQAAGVTLVLPNRAVATDTISIPTLRRKKTDESLTVAINDLYKNAAELKVNNCVTAQNRQYTSYYVSLMQNSLLSSFYTACSASKMIPQYVTFAANAAVNAVQARNPKLANSTYLLLDIKADKATVAFVSKGVTCGCYDLPFGYSILEHNRLAAEDMIIDHSVAELTVLNAKERAKAKQLTMAQMDNAAMMSQAMDEDNGEDEGFSGAEEPADEEESESTDVFTPNPINSALNQQVKVLPKKQPRKLPKFMIRPTPTSEEEYTYENFRIFVKWALNLIQANEKQLWHDKPEAVYVNMPSKYGFVLDKVNEEKKENGIAFSPVDLRNLSEDMMNNLESYGGFFVTQFNRSNNF